MGNDEQKILELKKLLPEPYPSCLYLEMGNLRKVLDVSCDPELKKLKDCLEESMEYVGSFLKK